MCTADPMQCMDQCPEHCVYPPQGLLGRFEAALLSAEQQSPPPTTGLLPGVGC